MLLVAIHSTTNFKLFILLSQKTIHGWFINNKHSFLTVLGPEKNKITAPADSMSGEDPLLRLPFSTVTTSHRGKREGSLGASFII